MRAHTHTHTHTHRHTHIALLDKPFRRNLQGWLESFNSNKAGRKACLLLVIPHLLDKDSQGSSAVLNWCTYPYLYRRSLWRGERRNVTGLAAIQALVPICLSPFMAELAFSGAISQAMRDVVFSLSLPLLMQLCRVNTAGGHCLCLGEGRAGPPTLITLVRLDDHLHVCGWCLIRFPRLDLEVKDTRSSVCAATMEM